MKSKILEIAIKEIGYYENPPNTNKTKYGEWFGFDGVPWCGIFASYCYYIAGYPLKHLGFKKGFAGCQTAMAYFKQHDMITTDPQPGDLVFFDWNNDGGSYGNIESVLGYAWDEDGQWTSLCYIINHQFNEAYKYKTFWSDRVETDRSKLYFSIYPGNNAVNNNEKVFVEYEYKFAKIENVDNVFSKNK